MIINDLFVNELLGSNRTKIGRKTIVLIPHDVKKKKKKKKENIPHEMT